MILRFKLPDRIILRAESRDDLAFGTTFTHRQNRKDFECEIRAIVSMPETLESPEGPHEIGRALLRITVADVGDQRELEELVAADPPTKLAQLVVDVANVCARAIRYRGWVSNVRELTPRRTPEMTFQFLDVERSTNGEDWTSQSPRDPLFEVLLERYDVTRTLDVKKVDDVVRAITLGSTHIPPEDEFLVNALDHLHERKYKFAILEAVNGLEILLSHVLDEFLFFQTLMPGKYRKALLGSPQFSLEFRLKGLLYLVLQDSDFQAFSMEKVLKFVSWRNKVVHGLDARRGSGRYDLPQEGDVLEFLSKKNDVWFPELKTRPRHGDRKGEPYIMGKVLPSQRLLKRFEERLVFGEMNLSEIVRSGAQMMLQYALEREVTEALGRSYYENAPATTKEKGRRNGYESHRVLTGEGAVTVQVPQVRETGTGFQSKILGAYVSRTEKLDELIARMYVHGMSTRDIEVTFADVLSGTGVSKSVVSRVTQCLSDDFEAFRNRDLSKEELLYLELDGTYLRYHQGAEKKEPILVATGYRVDGTRVLLHIGVGNSESYENWKGFLQEMVARGLNEPLLIVTDGNPGGLKAIEEVFPRSLKQRCQKHRLENILGKAPKEVRAELKASILESFHAESYEQGQKKGREVIAHYRQRFPSAMKCMEETLDACLQALRLPPAHHKRLRTSNLLERTFGEHKRRTKVIPHFFTEAAALKLSFAVLLAVTNKWRGVRMDAFTTRQIEEIRKKVLSEKSTEVSAA